jgi:predicted transcriptional regulator
VLLTHALNDVPVRELMLTELEPVGPEMSLDELVHQRMLHSDQRCFPVSADGRFVGLVCLADVRKIRDDDWPLTEVRNVMTPAEQLTVLAPDDRATKAVQVLAERDVDQLPVVEQGALKGLVRRRDILKWAGFRRNVALGRDTRSRAALLEVSRGEPPGPGGSSPERH